MSPSVEDLYVWRFIGRSSVYISPVSHPIQPGHHMVPQALSAEFLVYRPAEICLRFGSKGQMLRSTTRCYGKFFPLIV